MKILMAPRWLFKIAVSNRGTNEKSSVGSYLAALMSLDNLTNHPVYRTCHSKNWWYNCRCPTGKIWNVYFLLYSSGNYPL